MAAALCCLVAAVMGHGVAVTVSLQLRPAGVCNTETDVLQMLLLLMLAVLLINMVTFDIGEMRANSITSTIATFTSWSTSCLMVLICHHTMAILFTSDFTHYNYC
jgi:hypothetical protein